jgi:hypothetical protein
MSDKMQQYLSELEKLQRDEDELNLEIEELNKKISTVAGKRLDILIRKVQIKHLLEEL